MPTKQVELILQPKQLEVGQLMYKTGPDAATWIGAGGARAGGKSGGLRRIMLDRRQQRPGTAGAIVRRIYKDVKENHIEKYFTEFPELRNYWRATDNEIILPNKSRICFRYAENQQAVDQSFWGPEYYDIFVDQAEQFTERELTIIKSSNRWPNAPINDCKTGLFFNPGGIGTEFLRRVFWQKKFHANERPNDFQFVHLFGWDNYVWFEPLGMKAKELYGLPDMCASDTGRSPGFDCCRFHLFINRTSEGRKLDTMPPTLRAGHLLGSFESFAGQYFAGVWDESRLILSGFQEQRIIQPWWNRWLSHDDGFVHHACVLWWASGKVSPKLFNEVFGVQISETVTVVVVYRNLTQTEVEQGQLVRSIRQTMDPQEARTLARYFLSVDAWEKDSHGHSTADTITEECLRKQPIKDGNRELMWTLPVPEQADNGRIGGWRFLYAMMKKTADVLEGKMNPTAPSDDDLEIGSYSAKTPLLFISGNCQDVIDAVPMAIRDDKHPGKHEDIAKVATKSDDVLDSLRYGAKSMLNPKKTPFPVVAAEKRSEMEADGRIMTEIAIQMKKLEVDNKRRKKGRRTTWAR
jgi:hypothetical protein